MISDLLGYLLLMQINYKLNLRQLLEVVVF